jgi:hypothetical protein
LGGGHFGGAHLGGAFAALPGGAHFAGGRAFHGGFGGRFAGERGVFRRGRLGGFGVDYGYWPYADYSDYGPYYGSYAYGLGDQSCYQTRRYHTRTGWHTREVYVCS